MILINASLRRRRRLSSARRFCASGISDDPMTSLAIESAFLTKTKNAGGFLLSIDRCGVLGRTPIDLAIAIMFSIKLISAGGVGL
jgi:hypothetical protein